MERVSGLEEQLEAIQSQRRGSLADQLAGKAGKIGDFGMVVDSAGELGGNELRQLGLAVRDKLAVPGLIVLGATSAGKGSLVGVVSKELVSLGVSAGELIAPAAQALGGGGSRDPELAQAGGPLGDRLDEALDLARGDAERVLGSL